MAALIQIKEIEWARDEHDHFVGSHPVGTFSIENDIRLVDGETKVFFHVLFNDHFLLTAVSIADAQVKSQKHINSIILKSIGWPDVGEGILAE